MSNVLKHTLQNDTPVIIKPGEFRKIELPSEEQEQEQEQELQSQISLEALERIREETEKMWNKARESFENAKIEAAKIIEDAHTEAELLKQHAHKEGHKLGYQEGFDDGKNIGYAQMKDLIEETVQKAENILTLAESQTKKMLFDANDEIVDIAKMAIQRALCQEAVSNPEFITAIVKEALDKVRDHGQITIRVHPMNFDILVEEKHELQKLLGREHDLTITADKTIMLGGCVIDTSNGSVDARLDTKLELLSKTLEEIKEIEKSKNDEQITY